jgi:hypothetical protein
MHSRAKFTEGASTFNTAQLPGRPNLVGDIGGLLVHIPQTSALILIGLAAVVAVVPGDHRRDTRTVDAPRCSSSNFSFHSVLVIMGMVLCLVWLPCFGYMQGCRPVSVQDHGSGILVLSYRPQWEVYMFSAFPGVYVLVVLTAVILSIFKSKRAVTPVPAEEREVIDTPSA